MIRNGWIISIGKKRFKSHLRTDGMLDAILTTHIESLSEVQLKMLVIGQIIRYDTETDELKFMTESGEFI